MAVAQSPRNRPTLWTFVGVLPVALTLASCARLPMTPIRGDNHPHPGVKRARSQPDQGVGVSRNQGRIAFGRLRAAVAHFAFIKATEGADYVDPNFAANWAGARAAGMARAAYHFMFWCRSAAEQDRRKEQIVTDDPDA